MKNIIKSIKELLEYNYQNLLIKYDDYLLTIILNRPKVANALNHQFIEELLLVADFLEIHEKNQQEYYKIKNIKDFELNIIPFIEEFQEIRCILFQSNGKHFCSGADLNWLKEGLENTYDENYLESEKLVVLLEKLYYLTIPIVSKVKGYAVGGGVGILLCSDIVFADLDSKFGISEVSIGVVPVAIIKYLKLKLKLSDFNPYLITGERFDVNIAKEIGLVNFIIDNNGNNNNNENNIIDNYINKIVNNAPIAVQKVKEIINIIDLLDNKSYIKYSAELIAKLRQGNESIKGIEHFLNKENPNF